MAGRKKLTADGTPTTTPGAESARREEMELAQRENPGLFSGGRDTGEARDGQHAEPRGDQPGSDASQGRQIPRGSEG